MLLTKSILLLATVAYQVSAFNYNVTVSLDGSETDVCVEVLGDESGQGVYPVKCPAVCGQVDGSEFNAGQCEGTTGSDVYAHINNQNEVDYVRISNQYNYRFPCHSQNVSSSTKTFLCQGWLDPPSSATSSPTSFVTFTSAQPSASQSSFLTSVSSELSSVTTFSASSTLVPTTSVSTATSSFANSNSSASSTSSAISTSNSILTTATSTVATASSSSFAPSATSSGCIEGSKGKRLGNGYRGYCCASNDDCWNRCRRGTCNGPLAPPAKPTVTPTNCSKGTEGKMKGDGLLGDCCYSSADCKEKCVGGTCNAPPS